MLGVCWTFVGSCKHPITFIIRRRRATVLYCIDYRAARCRRATAILSGIHWSSTLRSTLFITCLFVCLSVCLSVCSIAPHRVHDDDVTLRCVAACVSISSRWRRHLRTATRRTLLDPLLVVCQAPLRTIKWFLPIKPWLRRIFFSFISILFPPLPVVS